MDASYTIIPQLSEKNPSIKVHLEIKTDIDGIATLIYLNEAWGEEHLFNCLSSIQVLNTEAEISVKPDFNKIIFSAQPNQLLAIEYSIQQDFSGEADISQYYRPIINNNYFHLFGHRLFLLPDKLFHSNQKSTIEINWEKVPYLVQHNFGTETEGVYHITKDELLESVVVGGDFRRHSVQVNGINLHLLTRGNWKSFQDEELLSKLESIVKIQREFWNDYSDDIYTVTLLPFTNNGGTYLGGTGLSKGFASYCTNSKRTKLTKLSGLYYHEIMHHWIGGKIRSSSMSDELWFSEGFTEYFALQLMLQQDEITDSEFDHEIKETYQRLVNSPYSTIRNNELSLTTENNLIEQVPYDRGLLYAFYLDNLLNAQSKNEASLKKIMLHILSDSKKHRFSNEYFKNILHTYFAADEIDNFNKYIINGELIPLPFFSN